MATNHDSGAAGCVAIRQSVTSIVTWTASARCTLFTVAGARAQIPGEPNKFVIPVDDCHGHCRGSFPKLEPYGSIFEPYGSNASSHRE